MIIEFITRYESEKTRTYQLKGELLEDFFEIYGFTEEHRELFLQNPYRYKEDLFDFLYGENKGFVDIYEEFLQEELTETVITK